MLKSLVTILLCRDLFVFVLPWQPIVCFRNMPNSIAVVVVHISRRKYITVLFCEFPSAVLPVETPIDETVIVVWWKFWYSAPAPFLWTFGERPVDKIASSYLPGSVGTRLTWLHLEPCHSSSICGESYATVNDCRFGNLTKIIQMQMGKHLLTVWQSFTMKKVTCSKDNSPTYPGRNRDWN